ncbi:MAG TPA: hypothetical protein VG308_05040 [Stellaceae bacterium]|nr:hypothetical protein [Stellaceae bacterium]
MRASRPRSGAPVFVVHSLNQAVAALEAAAAADRPIVLLSAPDAGIYAGAGWFRALIDAARAAAPEAPAEFILDCGDDAGAGQGALRAGIVAIVFTGRADVAARLAGIAAERGARLLTARPEVTVDLGAEFFADRETLRRRCAEALAGAG